MSGIETELKELLISALNLENMKPSDIGSDQPLFNEGLGLDSIDALELGVAIKKKYKVSLDVEDGNVRQHFHSVKTLSDFISNSLRAV